MERTTQERPGWALPEPLYRTEFDTKYPQNAGGAVCCIDCDGSMASVPEAIQAGWQGIEHDPSESWDFLGVCPECQVRREQLEREFHQQRGLLF